MRNFHDIEIKKDLVSREDGYNALERVLTSSDFATSPHLSAFLAYCVRETLEGRASALKAYNVATSVLGRPPTFDPQADPIVRVEATRLRRALERHYNGSGSAEPVQIVMPRGGYQINFVRREATNSSDNPKTASVFAVSNTSKQPRFHLRFFQRQPYWAILFVLSIISAGWTWGVFPDRWAAINASGSSKESLLALHVDQKDLAPQAPEPTKMAPKIGRSFRLGGVKVGTFAVEGNASMPWHVGAKISEEFTEALSRFDAISVYDWRSPSQPNDPDIYELSGRAVVDGPQTNTISVRIVHIASQRMVWSRDYGRVSTSRPGSFWRQDVIRAVATTIASNDGVIIRDSTAISSIDDPATVAKYCILRATEVLRLPEQERVASARQCIDEAIKIYPDSPNLLGLSARLRLDLPNASAEELRLALNEAQRANTVAPQSALILNILADVNTRLGLTQRANELGKLAVDLNPYDVTVLASQAARLASIGDENGAMELRSQIEPEFKGPALISQP